MKRIRFTEEQIIGVLREAEAGAKTADLGRTADHVIIRADSKATNLIDQKSFYVAISRAKHSVAIYTNDKAKLVSALNERAGERQIAICNDRLDAANASKFDGFGVG